MQLLSDSFRDGGAIPETHAFCRLEAPARVMFAANRNPHLRWSEPPAGTRSLALLCRDPDVPASTEDVNRDGVEVAANVERVDFFHWVLVELPADLRSIAAGEFADGVTPKGKGGPASLYGARSGINDYTGWFEGDHDMAGEYFGYDGPCPPWNDSIVHRYVFTIYALDVEHLPGLHGRFSGADALEAMRKHVLDTGSITGLFTLNARLRADLPA
ncbi:MAG: YbhB/YbcL family Raf kinase inhibitor-like protein [Burkholderiaceae bacterium]